MNIYWEIGTTMKIPHLDISNKIENRITFDTGNPKPEEF